MTPPKIVPKAFVSFGSIVSRMAGKRSFMSPQKGLVPAFTPDGCGRPVTGDNESVVVEGQQHLLNRRNDFRIRAAPQIRSADTVHQKRVACKYNVAIARQQK